MNQPFANQYRDAWAGQLRRDDVDQSHRVAGWVHRRRDHGGLIFIDVRDRTGLLQVVFHPDTATEAHAAAHKLRAEDVVSVQGVVVPREEGTVNPNLATGEVELSARELTVLADAETPPFEIVETTKPVSEDTRLRYRYLDLRREDMQRNMELRHAVTQAIRTHLHERDFLELETPILTRSTPEGARDFLVPSRLQPGNFYALPQSPQLFKQLLMMAGYERYYQIARCFRDEDLRADRQPEFTQLDLEMAFVEEEDIIELIEHVMARVFAVGGFEVPAPPWPRMSYAEAMLRFGTDRPDLRIPLEIRDVSDAVRETDFKVFRSVLDGGGVVRAMNAGPREAPRSELDALTELAQRHGAKGLVWAFVQEGGEWRSPTAKFLSEHEKQAIASGVGASEGDLLLAVADQAHTAATALGALRSHLGERDGRAHAPLWVVDFPLFEYNEDEPRWDPLHHPFTSPRGDLDGDPGTWMSRAYDLVVDGWELGGGSIRIHDTEVQQQVFQTIGITEEEAEARFGFL